MQVKTLICALISPLLALAALSLSTMALAKEISIFEQPQVHAKEVGKVDLSTGIIPIYTPEKSEWVKIADPRNGNVGWVKSKDLQEASQLSGVTFTQKIINDGKGQRTFQIIQYGEPQKFTDAQMKEIQQMRMQQLIIQRDLQKAIDSMFNNMNKLSQEQWNVIHGNIPIIIPAVIYPAPVGQKPNLKANPTAPMKLQPATQTNLLDGKNATPSIKMKKDTSPKTEPALNEEKK